MYFPPPLFFVCFCILEESIESKVSVALSIGVPGPEGELRPALVTAAYNPPPLPFSKDRLVRLFFRPGVAAGGFLLYLYQVYIDRFPRILVFRPYSVSRRC